MIKPQATTAEILGEKKARRDGGSGDEGGGGVAGRLRENSSSGRDEFVLIRHGRR